MSKPTVRNPSSAQIKASVDTGKIDVVKQGNIDLNFKPSTKTTNGTRLTLITTDGVHAIAGQAQVIVKALLDSPNHTATISELCEAKVGEISRLEKAGHYGVQSEYKILKHYTSGDNYTRVLSKIIHLS
tara:strand:- start:123 stop:509 length:387 start_codon:yes stop_codon:yes gene_type:complete